MNTNLESIIPLHQIMWQSHSQLFMCTVRRSIQLSRLWVFVIVIVLKQIVTLKLNIIILLIFLLIYLTIKFFEVKQTTTKHVKNNNCIQIKINLILNLFLALSSSSAISYHKYMKTWWFVQLPLIKSLTL